MYKFLLILIFISSSVNALEKKYEFSFLSAYSQAQSVEIDEQVSFGFSIAKNFSYSYLSQIELGLLQSNSASYQKNSNSTKIQRTFVNGILNLDKSPNSTFYALLGLGNESIDKELDTYESGIFANYGLGYRYKISDYGILKADLRHMLKISGEGDNVSLVVGFVIPFGKKVVQAPNSSIKRMHVNVKQKPIKKEVIKEKIADEIIVEEKIVEEVIINNDLDNDGVDNEFDNCTNTPSGAKVDDVGCIISVNLNINFKTASFFIDTKYTNKLEKFAQFLNDNPTYSVVIEAHTDSVGEKANNLILSQKRAEETIKKLVELNVSEFRLEAKGFGEENPITSNASFEGRAQNRRVTALIKQ